MLQCFSYNLRFQIPHCCHKYCVLHVVQPRLENRPGENNTLKHQMTKNSTSTNLYATNQRCKTVEHDLPSRNNKISFATYSFNLPLPNHNPRNWGNYLAINFYILKMKLFNANNTSYTKEEQFET